MKYFYSGVGNKKNGILTYTNGVIDLKKEINEIEDVTLMSDTLLKEQELKNFVVLYYKRIN